MTVQAAVRKPVSRLRLSPGAVTVAAMPPAVTTAVAAVMMVMPMAAPVMMVMVMVSMAMLHGLGKILHRLRQVLVCRDRRRLGGV